MLPVCTILVLNTVHPVLLPVCTVLILGTVHPVLLPVCTILVLNTVHAIGLAVCTALVLNTIHAIGLAVCTALVLNTIHAIGLAEALSARHTAVSACCRISISCLAARISRPGCSEASCHLHCTPGQQSDNLIPRLLHRHHFSTLVVLYRERVHLEIHIVKPRRIDRDMHHIII